MEKVGTLLDNDVHKDITWKIPNFFNQYYSSVKSGEFTFASATWHLRLYPDKLDSVEFKLVRTHTNVNFQSFLCKFVIMNSSFAESERFRYISFTESIREDVVFSRNRSQLLTEKDKIAREGTVVVRCEIHVYDRKPVHASSQTQTADHKTLEVVTQNLKTILSNDCPSDLLFLVTGREFRAQRSILRTRSEVFESMLSHDMMERNKGVIVIDDCDPAAFEQFLFYLYFGKLGSLDQGNMLGLYYIADKYCMSELKEECVDFIKKSFSPNGICYIIHLALTHGDSDLLERALEYFKKNLNSILPTGEWQLYLREYPTYANELLIKSTKT